MFGIYRVILAIMVVFQHLGTYRSLGSYAVFAFFIISGYLMTFILNRNYGYSTTGKIKFLVNRFLRIYPPYWGAMLISLLLLWFLSPEVIQVNSKRMIPDGTLEGILRNVFLIFEANTKGRLVPPSWALTVEIFYYLLIALGISKTKKSTVIWFASSLVYTLAVNILKADWHFIYFFFAAGSLPFSIGGLIYHFRDEITSKAAWLKSSYLPVFLMAAVFANYFLSPTNEWRKQEGFYLNLVLNTLLVLTLLNQDRLIAISKKLDKQIGDFSYPIYLIHVQAGILLYYLTGLEEGRLATPIAVLPLVFVLSWILIKAIIAPIENLRNNVKAGRGVRSKIPAENR